MSLVIPQTDAYPAMRQKREEKRERRGDLIKPWIDNNGNKVKVHKRSSYIWSS